MRTKDSKTEQPCTLNSVSGSYSSILELVEEGWNISDAIAEFGISRSTFYRKITDKQKAEIYAAKKLHTQYGVGS
jgi:transcriptional regulator of acetoin/glycerol metabolism